VKGRREKISSTSSGLSFFIFSKAGGEILMVQSMEETGFLPQFIPCESLESK